MNIPALTGKAACALLLVATLNGCAPLLLGGALVGGGLVASDRRTTGTQIEDEAIELKAASRIRDLATLGRANVTSYNRVVLLVGEMPAEAQKQAAEQAVAAIENVRSVINEIVLAPVSSVSSRSNDTLLNTKVKATFVDAPDLAATAVKVVVERGVVFLMGRVTEREATRAAELARTIPGVQRVVRVFEILTEQELGNLGRGVPVGTPAPVSTATVPK